MINIDQYLGELEKLLRDITEGVTNFDEEIILEIVLELEKVIREFIKALETL